MPPEENSMEARLPAPHCHELAAAVDTVAAEAGAPARVRIFHANGPTDAWSWIAPPTAPPTRIAKCRVTILPLDVGDQSTQLAMRFDPDDALDAFELIPDGFGHSEGIVFRTRDLADAIQTPPLRHFLSDVFSIPHVFHWFWTSPASQHHHHAYRGGLADHSVEVAENVLNAPSLAAMERELGVVFALIHDLGKLWCYEETGRHLLAMGHELVALDRLHEPLEALAREWPDGAVALRALLAGVWKQRGKPILAVGKLVQAYDQASAERDLARQPKHRHAPWRATPWTPEGSGASPNW